MHYRRIIGIIFAAMLVAIILQIPLHRRSAIRTWPMAAKSDPIPATVRSLRPVYPYSVIPGGVYSTEELKRAMFKDPMVREHYAGFDLAAAHLVTTAGERYAYVSYRMGGRLLWTTHKLRIPKGETLLTDGVTFCRTRCGNQLSEFPHRETASPEPPLRLLNLPNFTPSLLADNSVWLDEPVVESGAAVPVFEARLTPVLPSSTATVPELPFLPPPVQWFTASLIAVPTPVLYPKPSNSKFAPLVQPASRREVDTPAQVPEPRTLVLAIIALLGIFGFSLLRRKAHSQ